MVSSQAEQRLDPRRSGRTIVIPPSAIEALYGERILTTRPANRRLSMEQIDTVIQPNRFVCCLSLRRAGTESQATSVCPAARQGRLSGRT
jgi:hypothetical protein